MCGSGHSLDSCIISNNNALRGGGIYAADVELNVYNSIISNNIAAHHVLTTILFSIKQMIIMDLMYFKYLLSLSLSVVVVEYIY